VAAELERREIAHRRSGRDLAHEDLSALTAVVLCATDGRDPARVDLAQVDFFVGKGIHVVYPSIVGCDLIPFPYYEVKAECERRLQGSSHTIVRATQFHQLIWGWYTSPSRWPWLVVPAATRYQVLDPLVLARKLAEAAIGAPQGRAPDIGGPVAYEAKRLAWSCQRAAGLKRIVVPFNRRGLYGAALRAGANLTPNRDQTGETWNQFLERRDTASSESPRTRS